MSVWFFGLITAAGAIALALAPAKPTAEGRDAGAILIAVFAAATVTLAWLGWRLVGSGIFSGPDGVAIRRVLRRRAWLPWSEVACFDLTRARRLDNQFTRQSVAIAILAADRRKPLYCIGASFTAPQPAADQMLNALRNDQAAASGSAADSSLI